MNNISLHGSGSIASEKDAIAAGKGGIAVKGNVIGNVIITGDHNKLGHTSETNDMPKKVHQKTLLKSVFISYSHADADVAKRLKHQLELAKIDVFMDTKTLTFGSNITAFIEDTIRKTDYTIAIISKNSLMSAWVIKEYLETMMHEHVRSSKKFIPVYIDHSLFDDDFFITSLQSIQKEIDQLHKLMNDDIVKDIKKNNLTSKYDRLITLKQNLGDFIYKLNNQLAADFSTPALFNENVAKLIDLIKK